MPPFEVTSLSKGIKGAFKTPVPPIGMNAPSDIGEMIRVHMLGSDMSTAGYPNQSYISAIDLNTFKGNIMLMDPKNRSETQEILDDQEAFMALSAKVILDLLEEEPDTYTINDVKVRFR